MSKVFEALKKAGGIKAVQQGAPPLSDEPPKPDRPAVEESAAAALEPRPGRGSEPAEDEAEGRPEKVAPPDGAAAERVERLPEAGEPTRPERPEATAAAPGDEEIMGGGLELPEDIEPSEPAGRVDLGQLFGLGPPPKVPRPPRSWSGLQVARFRLPARSEDAPALWMLEPDSHPGLTENFRAVKNTLTSLQRQEGLKTCLMTGPDRLVGTSVMAFNTALMLAWDLADRGILIIDANLVNPSLHRAFGISQRPGLTNYLLDDSSLAEATQTGPLANLDLMAVGQTEEVASSPFDLVRFSRLMEEVRQRYDFVLIDSAPALRSSQTRTIAPKTDGVIVVARANQTRWEVVLELKRVLERDGARLLGSVLNKRQFVIPQALYRFL